MLSQGERSIWILLALCVVNDPEEVFHAMRVEVGCELASTVLAVVLVATIAQDLARSSFFGEAGLQCGGSRCGRVPGDASQHG